MKFLHRQVGRFAAVGVVNTMVDFGAFVAATAVGIGPLLANFVSTSMGMAVSFWANRRYVFGRTGRPVLEVTLFVVVAATGVWLIQPMVIMGVWAWFRTGVELPHTAGNAISKVIAIGVAAVWNFYLYKYVVFRDSRRSQHRLESEEATKETS